MKKIKAVETPADEKEQEAVKNANNYLGEWLQLFPKECEDTLAKKLQHVSKKDDEYIGEWLQHLPQDAEDYPGGWVINSSRNEDNFSTPNLQLCPKTVEEPPGGWLRKSNKEGTVYTGKMTSGITTSVSESTGNWEDHSPQGAAGILGGTLPRPQNLAESYEDWRLKYTSNEPQHFRGNMLQNHPREPKNYGGDAPRQLPGGTAHRGGWTLPRPSTLGDNYPLRTLQSTSTVTENYPGAVLRRSSRLTDHRRPRSLVLPSRVENLPPRRQRRESQNTELRSEDLPCSVHQLMFAEETIL
ncbi:hypothetical protein Hamer_G003102 [Homarus americanus]|uniref:Uncharacterized protein n=3 Tax=Homarus americanus TaxID=6706 RepID=A0A8J5TKN3_HOMAM|nr:hypothetical protein Hamer_G003102 [Homarus americanus]